MGFILRSVVVMGVLAGLLAWWLPPMDFLERWVRFTLYMAILQTALMIWWLGLWLLAYLFRFHTFSDKLHRMMQIGWGCAVGGMMGLGMEWLIWDIGRSLWGWCAGVGGGIGLGISNVV